jgi:hypothetical protein
MGLVHHPRAALAGAGVDRQELGLSTEAPEGELALGKGVAA